MRPRPLPAAHLQPGSLLVKAGDRVKRGQVLGLVGSSGNSDVPHLHFHISDRASFLGADGLPFVIESFLLEGQGVVDGEKGLAEMFALERLPQPKQRSSEMPLENQVIGFGER